MDKELNSRVDRERWQRAQAWERDFWLHEQTALARYGKNYLWRLLSLFGIVEKYRGDDSNRWWKQRFDNYSFLPGAVDNALEVGCGPYTNIRLISEVCRPQHLFLSDPLIRTYVRFKMSLVNELHREAACILDDHPIEELPFAHNYFDLVVMINVLDHVQDATLCMKHLIRILKRDGYFVIGQDLTNKEDLMNHPDGLSIGHPITLNEQWFRPHLEGAFNDVLFKILPRELGRAPHLHYGTLLYAGTKR